MDLHVTHMSYDHAEMRTKRRQFPERGLNPRPIAIAGCDLDTLLLLGILYCKLVMSTTTDYPFLTTTFTPDPGCVDLWTVDYIDTEGSLTTYLTKPAFTSAGNTHAENPTCLPAQQPGITPYKYQWPGVCFSGWTTAVLLTGVVDEPELICCPR
jgi:hypothetical protein